MTYCRVPLVKDRPLGRPVATTLLYQWYAIMVFLFRCRWWFSWLDWWHGKRCIHQLIADRFLTKEETINRKSHLIYCSTWLHPIVNPQLGINISDCFNVHSIMVHGSKKTFTASYASCLAQWTMLVSRAHVYNVNPTEILLIYETVCGVIYWRNIFLEFHERMNMNVSNTE
jgi:hypothetical protein